MGDRSVPPERTLAARRAPARGAAVSPGGGTVPNGPRDEGNRSRRAAERPCRNVKDGGDRWSVSVREQSGPWPFPPALPAGFAFCLGAAAGDPGMSHPSRPLPPPPQCQPQPAVQHPKAAAASGVFWLGRRGLGIRPAVWRAGPTPPARLRSCGAAGAPFWHGSP